MSHPPRYSVVKVNEHDRRTSTELAATRFSGIRTNDIMNQFEVWVVGRLERTLSYGRFFDEPHSLETVYCEVFGLKEVSLQGAVTEAILEIEGRKRAIEVMGMSDEGKRKLDEH